MQTATRRQFLKGAGGVALGVAALSGMGVLASCGQKQQVSPTATTVPTLAPTPTPNLALPWPYKSLDPKVVAERAYAAYYNGGCMYGAFEGVVGELREQVGSPYTTFPAAMMKYGAAGVAGWGTLCGALNGVAAAVFMVLESKAGNPVINEIYGWYGLEALPNYKPDKPKFDTIAASMANSQLCHISVTTWCEKSGFKALSPERAERCAWLTASVAKFTVEQLNKQAAGSFSLAHALPAEVTSCLSCHGKGGAVENVHASNQTSCSSCHSDIWTEHPLPLKK